MQFYFNATNQFKTISVKSDCFSANCLLTKKESWIKGGVIIWVCKGGTREKEEQLLRFLSSEIQRRVIR
jgi:hypothetical protein